MRRAVSRILLVLVAMLGCGIVSIELRHRAMYGHWVGYGWHVDVWSDRLENSIVGIEHVQYAAVTNFGLRPDVAEGCLSNETDSSPLPLSPVRIETQERSGWRAVDPGWRFGCGAGRIVRRTIWPLQSVYSAPVFAAYVGKKGDWVRLVVASAFDRASGRVFTSEPFQLPESAPRHCPKECVAIRSIGFCEPLSTTMSPKTAAAPCHKVDAWRSPPGSPHPPSVDVVLAVQNTATDASGSADFVVLTTLDSLIAPTNEYRIADMDELRTTTSWGREDDIRMTVIKSLQPGETRLVRIPGFDIQKITGFYADDLSSLWPWWVRVNVRIEDRGGERVATGRRDLPVIPPGERLAGEPAKRVRDPHIIKAIIIPPRPRRFW